MHVSMGCNLLPMIVDDVLLSEHAACSATQGRDWTGCVRVHTNIEKTRELVVAYSNNRCIVSSQRILGSLPAGWHCCC